MELEYTYWQDGKFYVGFLNDYPNDSTQVLSFTEFKKAFLKVYKKKQKKKKHRVEIRKPEKIKFPAEKE
ncbi:MAG: hypothetical protein FWD78_14470, partial [Treponema sp.]|nr:hypothetical protein [Treponema sp.]